MPFAASLLLICILFQSSVSTPLDDYVSTPDPLYSWYDTGQRITGGVSWEVQFLNMTSQAWLSSEEVNCSTWSHTIAIVTPRSIKNKNSCFLLIEGGSNFDGAPRASDVSLVLAAAVAMETQSLVVVVYQVPNQPCLFAYDANQKGRTEDELVAYTWLHILENPSDIEWLIYLPMTKAVVRAMDTVQDFAAQHLGLLIGSFVVSGASKRGFPTWLTAAVDERVIGIVPMVMDLLSTVPNLHHIYQSLGGWPFPFKPYHVLNITAYLDTAEFDHLTALFDPFIYKERLTMPKLLITASNDEYFLIDDSAYFWDKLEGEKHLLILSNTEHTLTTGLAKVLMAVSAFHLSLTEAFEDRNSYETSNGVSIMNSQYISEATPILIKESTFRGMRPKYTSLVDRVTGVVHVNVYEKPIDINLWYAYTPRKSPRRDFRWFTYESGDCRTVSMHGLCVQPILFQKKKIQPTRILKDGSMVYIASIANQEVGYGAFYVELKFKGPKIHLPFIFTTEAIIIPNTFPFNDCKAVSCVGLLV